MPTAARKPSAPRSLLLLPGGLLLAAWLAWTPSVQPGPLETLDGERRSMTLGGERFVVELATTPARQERGLMHRDPLPTDHGMLFVYAREAPRTFWMHNVRFPLDMLFLDAEWRIVGRIENAPPCPSLPCPDYASGQPARYVLELPGGSSERLGLQVGRQLDAPAGLP